MKKSRTSPLSAVVESPTVRRLPLVDLLVDTTAELYELMVRSGLSVNAAIVMFGLVVGGSMLLVMWRHRSNQARGDSLHLIGIEKPLPRDG